MTTTSPPTTLICISASEAEATDLRSRGPRRDFDELARAVGGRLLFREGQARGGWIGKLLGPHVRQAWRAAGAAEDGGAIFADGEHVGLPLLAFLALRRKHPARVVMLGHLPGRRWKRLLFRALTRFGPDGTLLVHSVEQARLVRPALHRSWTVRAVPYQVDTDYWRRPAGEGPAEPRPLVVAVGSEHRDYETLTQAAAALDARVVIAAGSHWARQTAGATVRPPNVEYFPRPLPFHELRQLYARATTVVVPLLDVPNQSGITTLLEAMSMGLPVIVTASRGQRECIRGPLVDRDGSLDREDTRERGPGLLGLDKDENAADTGLYVPVGDVAAMRAALELLLGNDALRSELGAAARASAERHFSIERFTTRLAAELRGEPATAEVPS